MNPYGRHRSHRVDANQATIITALRSRGYSVFTLSTHTDICVGYRGMNFLFEIKDPKADASDRKLTSAEAIFSANWRGQLSTVTTVKQIEQIISGKVSIWERGNLRK